MEWIDVNERVPNEGQMVLVRGLWIGEIYGEDEDEKIGFVKWESETHSRVLGTDYYTTWFTDITHWADLSELL